MAKLIILVTHGEATPDPNGFLTQKGREQMGKLKSKLPLDEIGYVISGEAPRHRESCLIVTGRKGGYCFRDSGSTRCAFSGRKIHDSC
ncbi:hypothetical protein KJA14_00925 [Patescibacteria group bacterium]|nr:hypothetical protein [Patescibacteria group bacterium]